VIGLDQLPDPRLLLVILAHRQDVDPGADAFEDKKLNIIGWKGPKAAVQAIKDASKSFKANGE
jgi:Arc/MetJ family transcription regulator